MMTAVTAPSTLTRAEAIAAVAARASDGDRDPRFPTTSFSDLSAAGLLTAPAGGFTAEAAIVREVAAADGSTARILDGHLNALERLAMADADPRTPNVDPSSTPHMVFGVWGADPGRGEGTPARVRPRGSGWVIDGVKTFCSGAGGVDRALVVVRDDDESRRLAYIDAQSDRLEVDRTWYEAAGLRSSESHRVAFHDAPVLALIGGPDELAREPFLSRDAIRTTATWVGLIDAITEEVTAHFADCGISEVTAYRLGELRIAVATVERWFEHTVSMMAGALDTTTSADADTDLMHYRQISLECRIAITACARLILRLSAEVCGSAALLRHSRLDRARRDLDLFLLQHRLDAKLAQLGTGLTERARP